MCGDVQCVRPDHLRLAGVEAAVSDKDVVVIRLLVARAPHRSRTLDDALALVFAITGIAPRPTPAIVSGRTLADVVRPRRGLLPHEEVAQRALLRVNELRRLAAAVSRGAAT